MAYAGPKTLDDAGLDYITGLVYGKSGVGKTALACSSQQFRTFVFDVDSGIYTAKTFQRTVRANIHYEVIRSSDQFKEVYDWLVAHAQYYQLVVVDTATELQRIVLREYEEVRNKGIIPDQQVWGATLNWMEHYAREFRTLPFHVLWTCHEAGDKDSDSGRLYRRPNFQGAFAGHYLKHFTWAARYFIHSEPSRDQSGRIVSQEHQRWLQCQPDQMTDAKCRGGALQMYEPVVPVEQNPTGYSDLDRIINAMVAAAQRQETPNA